MSDPLRTDPSRALDAASDADRDAKIEQLLLVGLDEYFAAQYEQAINVWTRALFIDRNHRRARAYIERARSALAERQRESEELLQNGLAAFRRGESHEARRLLQAAMERGAPLEEALSVLERLNRVDSGAAPRPARPMRGERPATAPRPSAAISQSTFRVMPSLMALLALIVAGAIGVASWNRVDRNRLDWGSFFARQSAAPGSAAVPLSSEIVLPVPRRGETALSRARALAASGHLRDGLTVLDAIRSTDAQKAEADRLRADIQRQLLGLTSAAAPEAPPTSTGDGRVP